VEVLEMRECPFCKAGPARLRVVEKWSGHNTYYARRVAYVRCLECNARGPTAKGLEYDIRNERPSMGAKQLLRDRAIGLWDAASPVVAGEFKLESEVAQ
jgi:hypothetical protein